MSESGHAGGCRCGAVRFRATGPGRNRCYCHCESCRRAASATPVPWVTFDAKQFVIERGELTEFASSAAVSRGFCSRCGTPLSYRHADRPAEIDVAVLALDDPAALAPECHIWVSDQLPWVRIGDDLPRFATWRAE